MDRDFIMNEKEVFGGYEQKTNMIQLVLKRKGRAHRGGCLEYSLWRGKGWSSELPQEAVAGDRGLD